MSCTYKTCPSMAIHRTAGHARMRGLTVFGAIVAVIDAFHEALEMRRRAHKKYFLDDE